MNTTEEMKEALKLWGIESKEQYYDYIVESIVNGQRSQARELIQGLTARGRTEAHDHIEENYYSLDMGEQAYEKAGKEAQRMLTQ